MPTAKLHRHDDDLGSPHARPIRYLIRICRWIAPPVAGVALLAGICVTLATMTAPVNDHWLTAWSREGGPIENATVIFYVALIAVLLALAWRQQTRSTSSKANGRSSAVIAPLTMAFLAFTLVARELDWHKRLTGENFLKTRFYVDEGVTFAQRAVAIAIIGMLAALVIRALYVGWGPLLRGISVRSRAAVTFATGLGLMFFSKGLDSSMGVVRRAGVDLSNQQWTWTAVEEGCEMFIPLCFVASVVLAMKGRNAGPTTLGSIPASPETLGQRERVQDDHRSAA